MKFPVFISIGEIYVEQGKYEKALQCYKKVLSKATILTEIHVANTYKGLAHLYSELNKSELSIENCNKALEIYAKIGDASNTASLKSILASNFKKIGDLDKAIEQTKGIIQVAEDSNSQKDTIVELRNLGKSCFIKNNREKGLEYYEKAFALAKKTHSDFGLYVMHFSYGYLYYNEREYDKALRHFVQAYVLLPKLKRPRFSNRVCQGFFRVLNAMENPGGAIYFAKKGINSMQFIRSNIPKDPQNLNEAFMQNKKYYYGTLADALMLAARYSEAEQILRMLKQKEYYDFICRDSTAEDPRRIKAQFNSFEQRWDGQLATHWQRCKGTSSEIADRNLEVERKAFEDELFHCINAFKTLKKQDKAQLKAEHFHHDAREDLTGIGGSPAMVSYLVLENGIDIVVTAPYCNFQKSYTISITSADLNKIIGNWRELLLSPDRDPKPLGRQLYQLLFKPIAKDMQANKVRHIVFHLDGALRYIPMCALYDGQKYLIQRYSISMFTFLDEETIKTAPQKNWRAAAMGTSKSVHGYPALSGVRDELLGIVNAKQSGTGVLPGKIYLDNAFTEAAIKQSLTDQFSVLHIASHFMFVPNGSEKDSFLLLGDGTPLSLAELRTGGFDLHGLNLLALSACETAVQMSNPDGRELDGLAITAQKNGAESVLATLWQVSDDSTPLIMKRFYRLREKKGLSKAEALREAQLTFLQGGGELAGNEKRGTRADVVGDLMDDPTESFSEKSYAHPYYWAPFLLMGNWQ